jgi:hypothetical protein
LGLLIEILCRPLNAIFAATRRRWSWERPRSADLCRVIVELMPGRLRKQRRDVFGKASVGEIAGRFFVPIDHDGCSAGHVRGVGAFATAFVHWRFV